MVDLQSLANLGEIIAAAAVVASLIYLAVQVRQSTRAQRTENYARALDRISAIQALLGQDGEMSRIISRGVRDTSKLTSLEKIRFTWCLYETFGALEFMFHTHQNDDLPAEVWGRWSRIVAWWMSYPGVQTWWKNRPVQFTEGFTAFVEAISSDNPTDLEANERWRQFIDSGEKQPQ